MPDNITTSLRKWWGFVTRGETYIASFVGNIIFQVLDGILLLVLISLLFLIEGSSIVGFLETLVNQGSINMTGFFLVLISVLLIGTIYLILSVYLSQIPIASVLAVLERKSLGDAIMLSFKKMRSMGSAALGLGIIMILPFVLALVPALIAYAFAGMSGALASVPLVLVLLLLAVLVTIFISFALWITPVVAYKEELGLGSLKRAFQLFKKDWITVVVVAFIIAAISAVISIVFQLFFRILMYSIIFDLSFLFLSIIFYLIALMIEGTIFTALVSSAQLAVYEVLSKKK